MKERSRDHSAKPIDGLFIAVNLWFPSAHAGKHLFGANRNWIRQTYNPWARQESNPADPSHLFAKDIS